MKIDAHNHPDWHAHNIDKFVANMDQYGIDKTWILTWECPPTEFDPFYNSVLPGGIDGPISLGRVISYLERQPDRFVGGYAPDPRRPDAVDRLKMAVEIYGIRVCGEIKLRMMYDNPDALRLYRYCGEAGLPVTVHIDYEFDRESTYPRPNWWYGGGIDAFERAVAACPDTVFLGHAPGFWCHISGDDKGLSEAYPDGEVVEGGKIPQMLRRYPNLYCDMSAGSGHRALARDKEFARSFIEEFQDRILFARDYFDNVHQELIEELSLPEAILEKLYSGNALKLVPLQ